MSTRLKSRQVRLSHCAQVELILEQQARSAASLTNAYLCLCLSQPPPSQRIPDSDELMVEARLSRPGSEENDLVDSVCAIDECDEKAAAEEGECT